MRRITADVEYCGQCHNCKDAGEEINNIFYPFVARCSKMKNKIIFKHEIYKRQYYIDIPDWCPFEEVKK